MPLYCYRTEDGRVVEEFVQANREAPATITLADGTVAKRSMGDEGQSTSKRLMPGNWPHHSEACGVNPDQIPEMKRRFPHHKFDAAGRMVFDNPKHMSRCLKDIGGSDWGKTP